MALYKSDLSPSDGLWDLVAVAVGRAEPLITEPQDWVQVTSERLRRPDDPPMEGDLADWGDKHAQFVTRPCVGLAEARAHARKLLAPGQHWRAAVVWREGDAVYVQAQDAETDEVAALFTYPIRREGDHPPVLDREGGPMWTGAAALRPRPRSRVRSGFTIEDMRRELATHEARLADHYGPTCLEQIGRTRRWLDLGDDRALFAEAAARREQSWKEHGTGSRGSWAQGGGLWHLAGEFEQARRALSNAVAQSTDWEPIPQGAAGVLYLLGELDRAARHAPNDSEGILAFAARDHDVALVTQARERWLGWERRARRGPHQDRGMVPLSGWDWIEETFRLESELLGEPLPSHLEMLRRTGMLREPGER